jgi:hypothetical protein
MLGAMPSNGKCVGALLTIVEMCCMYCTFVCFDSGYRQSEVDEARDEMIAAEAAGTVEDSPITLHLTFQYVM